VPPAEARHILLRLGNRQYPHMKLGVDRVPDTDEWVLLVDTHDRHILSAMMEDEREAVEAIIRRNDEVKQRIEKRWSEAGLPTFENYLRRRLAGRGKSGAAD
jgi:peptidyl-tRNA hydrolase